jgi:hypothetical protein
MKFPEDFFQKVQAQSDPHIHVSAGELPADGQFSLAE